MTRKAKQPAAEADYAIVVEPLDGADGGGWLASVPALPGCYGDGETRAEALEDALAAIEAPRASWDARFPGPPRSASGDSACRGRCMTSCAGWPLQRASA